MNQVKYCTFTETPMAADRRDQQTFQPQLLRAQLQSYRYLSCWDIDYYDSNGDPDIDTNSR